jgi:hypothetical protein
MLNCGFGAIEFIGGNMLGAMFGVYGVIILPVGIPPGDIPPGVIVA